MDLQYQSINQSCTQLVYWTWVQFKRVAVAFELFLASSTDDRTCAAYRCRSVYESEEALIFTVTPHLSCPPVLASGHVPVVCTLQYELDVNVSIVKAINSFVLSINFPAYPMMVLFDKWVGTYSPVLHAVPYRTILWHMVYCNWTLCTCKSVNVDPVSYTHLTLPTILRV